MNRVKDYLFLFLISCMVFILPGCEELTGELAKFGDAKSSNALLRDIELSQGDWEYSFNKYDSNYKIYVNNEVQSIKVKPTADHKFALINVQGQSVDSGTNSDFISLDVGDNEIKINVTAWDNTLNDYTLTVVRKLSDVTSLSSFSITDPSDVTLIDSGNGNYTAVVGTNVDKLTFNVETTDPNATVNMTLAHNGDVTIGSPVIINAGLNQFIVKVTAEDGETKTYYLASITQLSGDPTDCKVNSLLIDKTTLSPEFDLDDHNGVGPFGFDVEISEGKLTSGEVETNLILVTSSGAASVKITGAGAETTYPGGQISHPLKVDDFTANATPYVITCIVTSGDTLSSTTYNINLLVREGNDNAFLAPTDGIKLTWGTNNSCTVLYPGTFNSHNPRTYGFLKEIEEYIAVMYATETVTIKVKAEDPNATSITINGVGNTPDSNGIVSQDVILTKGYVKDVTIEVKAEDNTTSKTYIVRIKLLNVYEYYWGVYSPLNSASYERWEAWKDDHGLTIDDTLNGLLGGTLWWKTTTSPSTHMEWTNYSDGNAGGGTYNIRSDYNYNHPSDPNMDGFVIGEGITHGNLSGLASPTGFVYGGYTLDTPWGDEIAEVRSNYWVVNKKKVVCDDSWSEIRYMGEIHKMMYLEDAGPKPFSDPNFVWESPWIPAGYPLSGYPQSPAADWSWDMDL